MLEAARRIQTWLIGSMRGEVRASGLAGIRDAGASAYALAEEADEIRRDRTWDPTRQERAVQLFLVCTWNAFALQTAADRLLESDAQADRLTVGYVPSPTLGFAQACYTQAMNWVRHARCAQADAAYRVDVPLPAPLPPWQRNEHTRDVELRGLREVYEAVAPRCEYELQRLTEILGPSSSEQLATMKLLGEQMNTASDYARTLAMHTHSHEQRREVRDNLLQALSYAYTLGQVVAMPSLVDLLEVARNRAHPSPHPPLSAVQNGWRVLDASGTPIGTVARLEGELELGAVDSIVVSVGVFAADRRVRIDQIRAIEPGTVRLSVSNAELEPLS